MPDFEYGMKLDGSEALKTSDQVEKGLTQIEQHAKKVGSALEDGFHRGAAAAKNAQGQIEAMGVSTHDFEAALVRINAPEENLAKNMRVLNALQAQGVLSAKQYADELERIGKEHESDKAGATGGATPTVLSSLKDHLVGLAAPAASAATAISGITEAFKDWGLRTKDVDDATNSILKFHDSIDEARASMGEQRDLSSDLGINITKTARAYADTREGLDSLGLSSRQYTDITRQVTAALIVDGGAIEDVSGIMAKLQYVNEAGILTQGDLHKLYKQSPEIVKSFANSLGVTVNQLIEMAKQGKLTGATLEKIERGLGSGTEATDKYAQRVQNLTAVASDNHESFVGAALVIAKVAEGYKDSDGSMTKWIQNTNEAGLALEHTTKAAGELLDKLQTMNAVSAVQTSESISTGLVKSGLAVQATLDAQGNRYEQWNLKQKLFREQLEKSGASAEQVAAAMAKIHGPDWVDYYLQQLDLVRQPERDWAGRISALQKLMHDGTISAEEYIAAMERVTGHTSEIKPGLLPGARNFALPAYVPKDVTKLGLDNSLGQAATPTFDGQNPSTTPESERKTAEMLAMLAKGTKEWNDHLREVEKTAGNIGNVFQTEIAGDFGTFIDKIGEAAKGADVAWTKTFEDMASGLALAIVKAEALKALTGSTTGAIGAGVGGGYGGLLAGIFGGGFATGGEYTAPQNGGGQDSIPVFFRMNPGEKATFTNPGQPSQAASAGSGWSSSGGGGVTIINRHSLREDDITGAMDSRMGDQVVYNFMRRNRGAVRGLARR